MAGGADLGTAYITVVPSMRGAVSSIQTQLGGINVTKAGTKLGKGLGASIGSGLSTVKVALGTALGGALMGAARSIGGFMDAAIAASDATEKFGSTLSFAGIDTSGIERLTASTQEYADRTVYDLSDIQNITAQLASNGVKDYDRLAEAAGNLNAVAGGNKETFKSVGMVLTQTAGAGKLTAENWRQLSDAIPGAAGPIKQALQEAGAYTGNFADAMSKGEITAEEFNDALMSLGFQDAAVEAAQSTSTIEGAMGNLEAAIQKDLVQAFDAIKPAATAAINGLTGVFEGVGKVTGPIFEEIGKSVTGFMDAFEESAERGGSVIDNLRAGFESLPGPVNTLAKPLLGLADGVSSVFGKLGQSIIPALIRAGEALWPVVETVAGVLSDVFEGASILSSYLAEQLAPVFDALGDLAEVVFPFIQDVVGTAWQFIQDITADVWPGIQTLIDGAATAIKGAIDGVRPIVDGLGSAFDRLKPFIKGVADVLGPIIEGAAKICGDALAWIGEELLPDLGQAISVIMEGPFGDFVDFLSNEVAPILSDIGELLGPIIDAVEFIAGCTFEGPVNAVDPLLEKLEELGITVDETALKTETSTGRMSRAYSSDLNSAAGSLSSFGSAADECLRITQDSLRNTGKAAGDTEADLDRFAFNASGSLDGLATDTSISFDELATQTSSSMGSVKQTVQDGFESVRLIASGKVEEIKSSVSGAWGNMSSDAQVAFAQIRVNITSALDGAATAVSEKVESIKSIITGGWNTLSVGTTTAFATLRETVSNELSVVGATASAQVSAIRDTISNAFTAISTAGSTAFTGLTQAVTSAMGGAQVAVTLATASMTASMSGLQASMAAQFAAIRAAGAGALEGLAASVQANMGRIRSSVINGMTGSKLATAAAMVAMKAAFTTGFAAMGTTVTSQMRSIQSSIRSTFTSMVSQVTTSIRAAKDALKAGCAAMERAWAAMRFSPKHIPLPHFSVSGSLSANPPGVPTFSVSWYKQGGLFTKPNLIGVGESGPEAVLPLSRATDLISDGVADKGLTKADMYDAMVAALEKVGPPELSLYLNKQKFASSMARETDFALGQLQAARG